MVFPSERIGDYLLLAEIGRGGMGVVYRARDERSGQQVALKMLSPEAQSHKDSTLRFKREFRAIRRVVHPNVVRVFEAGGYRGAPYFTMELVEGCNIRTWLDGDVPIVHSGKDPPPASALSLEQRTRLNEPIRIQRLAEATVQVCFALSAIHAHRIIHRDLKPDNILVTPNGVVKLMDFGIAKQLAEAEPSTSGGMVVGTFKYLSPEQALGQDIDGRADLYCFGIVLYELLSGRHPFYSETSVGYAYQHARSKPHPISRFNPEVDQRLAAVAERLLAKEPADRYPTSDDLMAAVKEAVSGLDERVKQLKASTKRFAPPPFQMSRDPLFAPALVGRDREKQSLLTAVDRLLSGHGRFVVTSGASGSGKSRLLRDVSVEARDMGAEFLFGRAAVNERAPYAPVIEIFENIARALASRPRKDVNHILGMDGPVLARYLPSIAALPGVDKKQIQGLAPEDEQIRFRAAVAEVLGRYCEEKPRILVLDDLHVADELTIDLVRHLAGTLSGLVLGDATPSQRSSLSIFVTIDPAESAESEAIADLLDELDGQNGFMLLQLSPISVAAAGRLMRSMFGGAPVATVLAEAMHSNSEGLPYRIEERVRAMAESGQLTRRGRRWMIMARGSRKEDPRFVPVDEVRRSEVPNIRHREETAGAHRVDRLSAATRDVAERAAVTGIRVRTDVLFRVALRPEEELLDALDELIKRGLLAEEKGEGGYRFVNEGFRESLLSGMDAGRRARLHLLAAHSLEEIARNKSAAGSVDPELLANHYCEGGEPLRAFDYLAQAARRALQANAIQTATALVKRAQELLQDEADRAPADPGIARRYVNVLVLRLESLLAAGRPAEMIELAGRKINTLRGQAEARLVAEAIFLLAVAETTVGELDNALRHVAEVISVTERGGAHSLRCKAKRLAGEIYTRRGQPKRAMRYFRDTLELARAIGDDLEEELVRSALAACRMEAGELSATRRDYENLLAVAEKKGERNRAAHYVMCLGIVHQEMGDYDRAKASYERALEMAKAIGDSKAALVCQACIGRVHLDRGDVEAALLDFAEAREGLMNSGATEEVIKTLINSAQAYLLQQEDEQARAYCDEAAAEAERSGMAMLLAKARIIRGLARVRLEDERAGLADIERGLATARKADARRVILQGMIAYSEALILAMEQSRGITMLNQAWQQSKDTGFGRYSDQVANVRNRVSITTPNELL